MNAGTRAAAAYDELKRLLLSGEFAPAQRLDPVRLASALATGVTPIREALLRLAGERLVELGLNTGFHMPMVTESTLLGLYRWNLDLLRLALRSRVWKPDAARHERIFQAEPLSADVLFLSVAEWSRRPELIAQIASANDRLAIPRIAEAAALDYARAELNDMAHAANDPTSALRTITAYHQIRTKTVRHIVIEIYKMND